MPVCGFNREMVEGLVQFANGLFKATLERAEENNISIEEAFQIETEDMALFLEALEDRYQELKEDQSRAQALNELGDWVKDHDEDN